MFGAVEVFNHFVSPALFSSYVWIVTNENLEPLLSDTKLSYVGKYRENCAILFYLKILKRNSKRTRLVKKFEWLKLDIAKSTKLYPLVLFPFINDDNSVKNFILSHILFISCKLLFYWQNIKQSNQDAGSKKGIISLKYSTLFQLFSSLNFLQSQNIWNYSIFILLS